VFLLHFFLKSVLRKPLKVNKTIYNKVENQTMADYEFENDGETQFDQVKTEEKKYVSKKSSFHPSNVQGKLIKNAITGVEYPWRVGSNDARRLFRVVDTTGTCDNTGRRLKTKAAEYPNSNPNHCYYDSPQQFMSHRKMTVSSELVERWQRTQQEFVVQEEL
jgi:hypothetical protein